MADEKQGKAPSKPQEPQHPSSTAVAEQEPQQNKSQKQQSQEMERRDGEQAEQQGEAPLYSDFEFPDEDADLGNAWFPVRPIHNAMAFMITSPIRYDGVEYDEVTYAIRTVRNDGTVVDKMVKDHEFSDTYVAVPPAKLD